MASLIVKPNWFSILPPEFSNLNPEQKVHLVVSLIMYLMVPLHSLLWFLFESPDPDIKMRASSFLKIQGHASPGSENEFAPKKLYRLWHDRFPKCRKALHSSIVVPCAHEMALAESNRGISDPALKVKLSKLGMSSIRDILNPGELIDKYREMFTFMFPLLETFAAAPNEYRRKMEARKSKCKTKKQNDDIDDIEDSAAGLEDGEIVDEGWGSAYDWRSNPKWAGFSTCPHYVSSLCM